MSRMDHPKITSLTVALATLRRSSVFMIEITKNGGEVFANMHSTLNDRELPQLTVMEALVGTLTEALKFYSEQLETMRQQAREKP